MKFTDLFVRRPILSIVVSILILLVGISSLFSLPIREYPEMESATIVISTNYPGATQDVMQGFVTTPLAQAISTASGIEYLTSTSSQGSSEIKAKLVLNADADRSMTEILAKVQQVSYRLPEGANNPVINKITDGASAVQYVSFIGSDIPMPVVTDFASRVAEPLITSISGVASVRYGGAQTLAMRVWLDPDRLAARNLSASEVANALRSNNIQAAPGQLKTTDTVINVTASTDVRDIDDFRKMVVKRADNDLVRLSDVATIELGGQNYDSSFTSSGQRALV
ncbi:MAG: efflux RND transporter permease subunit, partial [Pseudomonadales bacterium]|nr:efflux RND transporter permease subunit [Pseudomonadales bacterium]